MSTEPTETNDERLLCAVCYPCAAMCDSMGDRCVQNVIRGRTKWQTEAERLASALGLIVNGRWNVDTDRERDVREFARDVLRGGV